jgi:hypothetical protein
MEYLINLDFENKIVRTTVRGVMRSAGAAVMAKEEVTLAREHGWNKFFVDLREAVVQDSTIETYQHMDQFEAFGYLRSDFIAAVYTNDEASHRFAEDVVRNRGWLGVRYFKDALEAELWLQASSNGLAD